MDSIIYKTVLYDTKGLYGSGFFALLTPLFNKQDIIKKFKEIDDLSCCNITSERQLKYNRSYATNNNLYIDGIITSKFIYNNSNIMVENQYRIPSKPIKFINKEYKLYFEYNYYVKQYNFDKYSCKYIYYNNI